MKTHWAVRVSLLVLIGILLLGVSISRGRAQAGVIEYPRDASTIVFRIYWHSGPPVVTVPIFTLYGDGTVIYVDNEPSRTPGVRYKLRRARLSEEEVQEVLRFVVVDNNFLDLKQVDVQKYNALPHIDFQLNLGARQREMDVFLASINDDAESSGLLNLSEEDKRVLQKLLSIGKRFNKFHVPNAEEFVPDRIKLIVEQIPPDHIEGEYVKDGGKLTTWPFDDVPLDEVVRDLHFLQFGSVMLEGEVAKDVWNFTRRASNFWSFRGAVFGYLLRPYVPHE